MPVIVHSVASDTSVALVASLVEARDRPDWRLAEGRATGLHFVGDKPTDKPGVLSSGLFRQRFGPAELSVEGLGDGHTALPSNAARSDQLEATIKRKV